MEQTEQVNKIKLITTDVNSFIPFFWILKRNRQEVTTIREMLNVPIYLWNIDSVLDYKFSLHFLVYLSKYITKNQNYVPDLVVQCARHIIQIILQHAHSVSTKNFRYYSLSVYMYTFFQKLRLPHWLKQVILSIYELLEEGHANIDLNTLRNVDNRGHTSVLLCNIY